MRRTCCATSGSWPRGRCERDGQSSDQVLPSGLARGRQPAARPRAAVDPGRSEPQQLDHQGPSCLPGLRRGARRALCAGRGDARERWAADSGQRDGLPGGLLDALSGVLVADALASLAVRERARGRDRDRGGPEGAGTQRRARGGAGGRRRHGGHRDGMSFGHVRARRRRALHLLRQRGLHEHGRAALGVDAAGRAHDDHAGRGRGTGQRVRAGQGRAAHRDGPRDPLRCHGDGRRPARPRGEGRARDGDPGRPLPARARHLPARLELPGGRHDQGRAAGRRDRPVPRLRGQPRRGHRGWEDPRAPAGGGLSEAAGSLPPPFRAAPARGRSAAHPGDRRSQHQPLRAAVMEKPFAITLEVGSSLANKTGAWRDERPVYVDRLPPCNAGCPAGENIQQWLYHAEGGDYEAAWRTIMQENPLPAVMGRVCYHPCTSVCNRAEVDEAVGINSVERFLGDEAIRQGWETGPADERPGKRVLVVGAGPSGLSAAYHLTRLGHGVTIMDAGPLPGGMMRFGIPSYRLPRDVLDAEIQRILELGVTLECDRKVTDILQTMRDGSFAAAFLAVGAHIGRRAYIPAGEAAHILDAVSMLRDMEGGERPMLGRRVVIYGGGNTAMDAARTAKRLGASDAIVVYRRTRERMPAHDFEVQEALEEGVVMKWLSTIKSAGGGSLVLEKMELDDTGFPQPTGELEELQADSVVLALGQEADLSLLDGVPGLEIEDGVVKVAQNMMTGHPGIFAGGDMVPAERTVTVGVGHGKKAARHIDAWLRGRELASAARHEPADFQGLNTWYFSDAPKTVVPRLDAIRRQSTFAEVQLGLDEGNALFEARRCLSCGSCFECDNCYGLCPDNAVVKLSAGDRYEIDYDYCKGCGICATECPCGAIAMEPEPS